VTSPAIKFLSSNAWAMAPEVFSDLAAIVERHASGERLSEKDLRAAVGDKPTSRESSMYRAGDVAVIPIRGVIARYADQVNGICQDTGRSADSIQADLKAAVADLMVKSIALRIDSPGGTVAGTAEIASAIKAATAAGKPVHAYVDGLAASAAYWIASAAESITVSASTAQAGSIGVITAHYDETAALERRGYKLHVVRSVALKAPGTMGESLSAEQLDSMQRRVAQLHAAFASAVQENRKLSDAQIAQATTGEVWAADQAQKLGLVDGMQSWDAWLASISTRGSRRNETKASAMNIDDLVALTDKHPAKAAEINRMAKEGKTSAEIDAHFAEAAKVEEVAAIKAACDSAMADLKAEKEAHAKTAADLKAALEKAYAIKAHKADHSDPGNGKGEFRRSAMDLKAKAGFIRAHGRDAYEALPE
jgi:signal peptide peptidase SppA